MKWAGMYLVGFIILMGGILAALWKMGILENIGTTWTVIGVVILIGLGVMFSVANSGVKENIQIDPEVTALHARLRWRHPNWRCGRRAPPRWTIRATSGGPVRAKMR